MLRAISKLLVSSTMVMALGVSGAAASNIMFVMDASGSMKKDAGNGFSRMDNAQNAIARMLTDVDDANRYGLTVYGHRKAKECTDIQLVAEVGSVDAGFINEFVQQLEPIGETPIAESVRLAAASLERYADENNQLVVVTDGIEECGGDVCAVAGEIADSGIGLQVNVVGFTLNEEQQSLVRCLSDKTGGKFYDAQDSAALEAAFTQVREDIVVAQAEPVAAPESKSNIWFEDNFDGDALSEAWAVDNENADLYAVDDGKLLVVFPDPGGDAVALGQVENVFRLNKDMPKGDWTMEARFEFGAQTHGEWLRMGISTPGQSSLLASYQLFTYNYAMTQMYVRVDKNEQDKNTNFTKNLGEFNGQNDLALRSLQYAEDIDGVLLKMVKNGRGYTVYGKLDGPADAQWAELQKMTSIKSPGDALTLAFGNGFNGYAPRNGEGFVEVDWVRVTTQ